MAPTQSNSNGGSAYKRGATYDYGKKLEVARCYEELVARENGNKKKATIRLLADEAGVSRGFAEKIIKEIDKYGAVIPPDQFVKNRPLGAGAFTLAKRDEFVLESLFYANPKSTRAQYQQKLYQATGTFISSSSFSRWLKERLPSMKLQLQQQRHQGRSSGDATPTNNDHTNAAWIAPIMLQVNFSVNSPDTFALDVTKTLGELRSGQYRSSRAAMLHGAYWLPATVQGREGIRQVLGQACQATGFELRTDRATNKACKNGLVPYKFRCKHGKVEAGKKRGRDGDDEQQQQQQENTTTRDRCPFFFTVYCDETSKRWVFPRIQGGKPYHCGHDRQEGHNQLPTRTISEHDAETEQLHVVADPAPLPVPNNNQRAVVHPPRRVANAAVHPGEERWDGTPSPPGRRASEDNSPPPRAVVAEPDIRLVTAPPTVTAATTTSPSRCQAIDRPRRRRARTDGNHDNTRGRAVEPVYQELHPLFLQLKDLIQKDSQQLERAKQGLSELIASLERHR